MIMKKMLGMLAFLSAIVLFFCSCSNSDDETKTYVAQLELNADTLYFGSEGGVKTVFAINAGPIDWTFESTASWCRAQDVYFESDTVRPCFQIFVDETTEKTNRMSKVVAKISESNTAKIIVIQIGVEEPSLSVNSAVLDFSSVGGNDETKTIQVNTNQSEWDAVSSEDWCIVHKYDGEVWINVRENTGFSEREAEITFTAGEATPVKVTVKQAAAPSYTLSFTGLPAGVEILNADFLFEKPFEKIVQQKITNKDGSFMVGKMTGPVSLKYAIFYTADNQFAACPVDGTVNSVDNQSFAMRSPKVMDYVAGGVVIKTNGENGIDAFKGVVISVEDKLLSWGEFDTDALTLINANDRKDGEKNMATIGKLNKWKDFPAAEYCHSYIVDGQGGWYLPAIEELEGFYKILNTGYNDFTKAFSLAGGENLDFAYYWSSTEVNMMQVNGFDFKPTYGAGISTDQKTADLHVRCMKKY